MLKGTASASPHSVVRAPLLPRVQRCLAASVTPLFWRALLSRGVCARAFLYHLNKEGHPPPQHLLGAQHAALRTLSLWPMLPSMTGI